MKYLFVNFIIIMTLSSATFAKAVGLEFLEEQGKLLRALYEKASQSVVVIETPSTDSPAWVGSASSESFQPDSSFSDSGSGIVFDNLGHVVTNHHVVQNVVGDSIRVKVKGAKPVSAKIIATDPKTDLAVLQLPPPFPQSITAGNSDEYAPGDFVLTIGNPFGLEHSVSLGIISGLHRRPVTSSAYEDFIQTDAAINPGNSGGPLLNLKGQWIGINTMVHGADKGLGFSIPSNQALPIIKELIEKGEVSRPWVGLRVEIPDPMSSVNGATVGIVAKGSPASLAGLKKGDEIVKINGTLVTSPSELQKTIWNTGVGGNINLEVKRGKKVFEKVLVPVVQPKDPST